MNKILKQYCPYEHIEDCRKAFRVQEEAIEDGKDPDEEYLKKIATQNALTTEIALYRIQILKKYPEYPNEDKINFITNTLANPRHDQCAEEVA